METNVGETQELTGYSFKSYYVVWKRNSDTTHTPNFICLNRTMQYGNHVSFSFVAQKNEV